jgi:hypothetical protein
MFALGQHVHVVHVWKVYATWLQAATWYVGALAIRSDRPLRVA